MSFGDATLKQKSIFVLEQPVTGCLHTRCSSPACTHTRTHTFTVRRGEAPSESVHFYLTVLFCLFLLAKGKNRLRLYVSRRKI